MGRSYSKSNVYCAREVSPGVLWLATWGQGLLAYDIKNDRFSTIIAPSEISNFRDLQIGSKGEIWAGSSAGLMHFSSPKANYELVEGASVRFENVSRVFIDRSNIVWIGCENGTVGKISTHGKQFSTIPSTLPLSKSPVSAVWADQTSNDVYFTSGSSLVRYNTLNRQYQTFQSLYSDIVSIAGMFEDRSLLCVSSTGLSIFDKSKGRFAKLVFDPKSPVDVLMQPVDTLAPMASFLFRCHRSIPIAPMKPFNYIQLYSVL
jgi:ligand-binding sensor domain-containing protein